MQKQQKRGFTGLQVTGIVLGVILATAIITLLAIRYFLFPQPFKPVQLTPREEQQLEQKLQLFANFGRPAAAREIPAADQQQPDARLKDNTLAPEAYSEDQASRDIRFTERELNALLAKNTDLADKMAIDLAQDLLSVKLVLPVDPDFPILGGKTLRVRAGAELAYRNGRPVVKLRGVSLMGVPIPNAWLGNMKNIDLVKEFGQKDGFWKLFSEGVASIQVEDGRLHIRLKE